MSRLASIIAPMSFHAVYRCTQSMYLQEPLPRMPRLPFASTPNQGKVTMQDQIEIMTIIPVVNLKISSLGKKSAAEKMSGGWGGGGVGSGRKTSQGRCFSSDLSLKAFS